MCCDAQPRVTKIWHGVQACCAPMPGCCRLGACLVSKRTLRLLAAHLPGRCAAPWPASSARPWGPPPAAAAHPQPASQVRQASLSWTRLAPCALPEAWCTAYSFRATNRRQKTQPPCPCNNRASRACFTTHLQGLCILELRPLLPPHRAAAALTHTSPEQAATALLHAAGVLVEHCARGTVQSRRESECVSHVSA